MKVQPSASEPFSETFYATGFKVWIRCHPNGCEIELAVAPQAGVTYDSARLEVLLQPRGRDDLPWGSPLTLASESVPLAVFPGNRWQWGRLTLPGDWQPATLRRCHLRLTPHCRSEFNSPAP